MNPDQVEFILRYDPHARHFLVGDPLRIRQVLINLCGNAIKFTEKGHVYLEVETRDADDQAVEVNIAIHDTGIGIPADKQKTIFEKFDQGDTSTARQFGGTGLGLAISKQIVEAMGGDIRVESLSGHGTSFYCKLYLLKNTSQEQQDNNHHKFEALRRRSLVIDDSPQHGRVLSDLLNYLGQHADFYVTSQEALTALRKSKSQDHPYDYILIDDRMPDIRGMDLVHRLAEEDLIGDARIILLGNHEIYSRIEDIQAAGITAVASKPICNSEIINILDYLEEHKGKLPEVLTRFALGQTGGALTQPDQAKAYDVTVLLTEDNHVNQEVFTAMMSGIGVKVDVASGGREALDLISRRFYDLIFMDCQMPGMDGFETTSHIREMQSKTGRRSTIIALTANALQGDQEKCLAAGMNDYMAKPFSMDQLKAMLSKWAMSGYHHSSSDVVNDDRLTEGEVINHARLDAIRSLGDDAFMRVISLFIENATQIVNNIQMAYDQKDFVAMSSSAHALKSICGQVGAMGVAEDAEHLESVCRDYKGIGADIIVINLESGLKRVVAELHKMQNSKG
jgi:CheY-like chemotaxis protein/HPt (histidine-containing phosphotransfer) domain-containing protein